MKGDLLGPSGHPRRANDAYFTLDPRAVDTLACALDLHGLAVWEPAAGRGDLIWALERHGAELIAATDLSAYPGRDARIVPQVDFLKLEQAPPGIAAIITNPPSRLSVDFVDQALSLLPDGTVAMLLRHEWICRKGWVFEGRLDLWVPIRGRLRWFEGRTDAPRHNWAWGVWGPSRSGKRRSRLVL